VTGTDNVFTPGYSYLMTPAANVNSLVPAHAGNTAGAASTAPASPVALAISGTEGALPDSVGFTLTSSLSGATAVSYHWRRDNWRIPPGAAYEGVDSPALTVGYARQNLSGAYTLQAALANGDILVSNPKHITIGAPRPPQITRQPHPENGPNEAVTQWTVNAGDNVSLFAEATGDPVLKYQWQKRQRHNTAAWDSIPGAAFPALNLGHVTIEDGGVYRAVVVNNSGSAVSNGLTLIVYNNGAPYNVGNSRGADNGGGGAPSLWVLATLAALSLPRLLRRLRAPRQ
jgi:hypothetical protein